MNLPFRFRKGFRHELLVLLAPIVVQNLISASVSLADVIMLGRVDQVSISASSLAGQVMFLLFTVFYGLSSALTILVSQYWGKKDCATISRILGIGLLISILFSSLTAFMALFFPTALMRVWTNDPELIAAGANYLRFVAFSYLFAGLTQPYLAVMRSCERVTLSTLVSAFTLTLNVLLNAVLIFGLFGLPALGLKIPALRIGILTLGLYNAAYIGIILESGIRALPKGQTEAAQAIGLSRSKIFFKILFPQTLSVILPPLTGQFLQMVKDSSVLSIVTVAELTMMTQKAVGITFEPVVVYVLTALLYWGLNLIIEFVTKRIERKHRIAQLG